MKALASGDEAAVQRFDDLHSFDVGFRASLAQLVDTGVANRLITSHRTAQAAPLQPLPTGDGYETICAKLSADGLGQDLINRLVDAVRAQGHDAQKDLLGFYEKVIRMKGKAKKTKNAKRDLDVSGLETSDVRRLVLESSERGITPVEALREAGLSGVWPERDRSGP